VDIDLVIHDRSDLPPDTHIALYRITQEALNNIVKHSQATKVEIVFRSNRKLAGVTIQDNGRGFDTQNTKDGMGLHTMRERAHHIGATFEVRSVRGEGTMVSVTWKRTPSPPPTAEA